VAKVTISAKEQKLLSRIETLEKQLADTRCELDALRRLPPRDVSIDKLDLSVRVRNALTRSGVSTIGDAIERVNQGYDAMLAIRNFGDASLTELLAAINRLGYSDYLL
jgi:DNA-directed RNA polymerase alpha subunit